MTHQKLTHLNESGEVHMVDIGSKAIQHRTATAGGTLHCAPSTIRALREKGLPKGDVLAVARIAGIQAAKRTAELIPLCHTLPLDRVAVEFQIGDASIDITCTASTSSKTGVEMEALTGVSVTALTLYDMLKAVDKEMVIGEIKVLSKTKQ